MATPPGSSPRRTARTATSTGARTTRPGKTGAKKASAPKAKAKAKAKPKSSKRTEPKVAAGATAKVERRGRKKGAPRPSSDQILEAAERVFAEQGFADTSLRQLMAAAGVSTTAFYARFASRDAVLEAITTRFLAELAEAAAVKLATARNVEEGFAFGVDVLVTAVKERRALMRLLLGEATGSEVVRNGLAQAFEQIASLLSANLERLVVKGVIEPADARAVGWAFVGALKIQLERWALFEAITTDELAPALRSTATAMLPIIKRRTR